MLQKLTLHFQQIIKTTSTQDLDPRPLTNHDHPSILPFEMYVIESGETPSHILKWSPVGFLRHIKRRTIDDRFPLSLSEVWFSSTLGLPIPALIGPFQRCSCNAFDYESMMFAEITYRLAKLSRRIHRFMIGWCIVWQAF
jgi:hypothetical protein